MPTLQYTTATATLKGFKNRRVYQVPKEATHAQITNIQISNKEDDTIFASAEYVSSKTLTPTRFIQGATIPTGGALNVIAAPINLNPGDMVNLKLTENINAVNNLEPQADVFVSVVVNFPESEETSNVS